MLPDRIDMLSAIKELERNEDVKGLIMVLRNRDPGCREESAKALGRICSQEAVEPLIDAFYAARENKKESSKFRPHLEDSVACAAALALGQMGDSRAVEPLIDLLEDKSNQCRWRAPEELGKFRDNKRVIEALVAALGDSMKDVGIEAIPVLKEIGAPALEVLAACKDRRAIDLLVEVSESQDPRCREEANSLLKHIRPTLIATLCSDLKSEDVPVRWTAAKILGRIGDAQAVEPLLDTLKDRYPAVRSAANQALKQIQDPQVLEQMQDPQWIDSLRATYKLELQDWGPYLFDSEERKWHAEENDDALSRTADEIRQRGEYQAVPALIAASRSYAGLNRFQRSVLQALGELGSPSSIELFVEKWDFQPEAGEALWKIARQCGIHEVINQLRVIYDLTYNSKSAYEREKGQTADRIRIKLEESERTGSTPPFVPKV